MKVLLINKSGKISAKYREMLLRSGVTLTADISDTENIDDYGMVYENHDELYDEIVELLSARAQNRPALIGETKRLFIREIGPEQAEAYRLLIEECRDELEDVTLAGLSPEEFLNRHKAYIKYSYELNCFGIWGLFSKNEKDKMIGFAGVSANNHTLCYAITSDYRRKGYAYEACSFILQYMSEEYSINDISVHIKADNLPSINLAKKLHISELTII